MQIRKLVSLLFLCTAYLRSEVVINLGFFGGGTIELDFLNANFLSQDKFQQQAAATGGLLSMFNSTKPDIHVDILDFFKKNQLSDIAGLPINCSLLFAISELIDDNIELGIAIFWMKLSTSQKTFHYQDDNNKDAIMPINITEDNLLAIGPQAAITIDDTITIRLFIGFTPSLKSYIISEQKFQPAISNIQTTAPTAGSTNTKATSVEDHSISITNAVKSVITDNLMLTALLTIGFNITEDMQIVILIGITAPIATNHSKQVSAFAENNAILRDESIVFACSQHKIIIQLGVNYQIKNNN
jgi:hypothetical protein